MGQVCGKCLLAAGASDNHLTLATFHRKQQITFIVLANLLHISRKRRLPVMTSDHE